MVTIKIKIMNPKLTMYACHIYFPPKIQRGSPSIREGIIPLRRLRELEEIGDCCRYYSYCY